MKYKTAILYANQDFSYTFYHVGKMWGKKTEKPSQNALYEGFMYPEDYLFSNQFMEDLGRIYRLKKVIPDPEMYASR